MKKAVCAVALLLALWVGAACGPAAREWEKPAEWQKGSVFVNGVELEGEYAMIYSEPVNTDETGWFGWAGTEVPFTAILKACGFEVAWTDDFHARMTFRGKAYTLDLQKVDVTEDETGDTVLLPAPGSRRSYTVAERELYLDSTTIESFFTLIGERLMIDVDVAGLRVDVTFQTESPAEE